MSAGGAVLARARHGGRGRTQGLLPLLALGGLACGGGAAFQLCQDEVNAICERAFACFSASEQADAGFIALYGTSQSDCVSKVGDIKCAAVSDTHPCGGAAQQTYDPDAGAECLASTQAATCDQVQDPTFRPSGCDQVCQ